MAVLARTSGDDEGRRPATHIRWILVALFAAAFAGRMVARMAFGPQYFWANSYLFYYSLAVSAVGGKGLCLGTSCARYPPLYPLFLTLSVLADRSYWLVVVPQALLGAGTALCAYLIGRELFDRRIGLLSCAMTAVYPYYLMHDTALQETGMVTFCVALAVWLLLRARRLNRNLDWLFAGIALGAIPLVRVSVAPAAAVGVLWCMVWGASGTTSEKLRKTAILALAVAATVSPWLYRNYRVTGAPVLSSEAGRALWIGNNPDTFSYYPAGSIDRSTGRASQDLPAADRTELASLASDEIASSNWYARRALQFMAANPVLTVKGALRKIAAGFSWRLNPHRDRLAEAAYAIGYVPVAILGLVGMVLARKRSGTILIALLFLAFIAVTAVFWAHTSHRTYLDVYWIVFAASVVERIWHDRRIGRFSNYPPEAVSAGPGNSAELRPIIQAMNSPSHS